MLIRHCWMLTKRKNNNHREREREDYSLHFTFKFYVLGPSFKRRGSMYTFRFMKYNLNHEMGITWNGRLLFFIEKKEEESYMKII